MRSSFFKKTDSGKTSEGPRLNRKLVTFVICLFVSSFFWLLLSLSKEYSIVLSFPVEYINLPEDKIISNTLPSHIDIEVKARGFHLISYKMFPEREIIRIDMEDARPLRERNHFFLLTNSRTDKVTAQFDHSVRILRISPDTIYVNVNKKLSKIVPVYAKLKIDCEDQYELTDTIRLDPKFIRVSGSADILDKIDSIRTVPMSLKGIKKPLLLRLEIERTSFLKQVELDPESVKAIVNVSKYTEASVELPVEVENLPEGYALKTFPDKVMVKYKVRFEDYEKIYPTQFRVIVDYSRIDPDSKKLKLQLVKQPEGIRSIRLSTEKVEYIIRK